MIPFSSSYADVINLIALLVIRCYEDMPLQELQATQEQRTIQNLSDTLRTILRLQVGYLIVTILNPQPLMAAKITKPIFFSHVIGIFIQVNGIEAVAAFHLLYIFLGVQLCNQYPMFCWFLSLFSLVLVSKPQKIQDFVSCHIVVCKQCMHGFQLLLHLRTLQSLVGFLKGMQEICLPYFNYKMDACVRFILWLCTVSYIRIGISVQVYPLTFFSQKNRDLLLRKKKKKA